MAANEKMINLYFEEFLFPVKYSTVETFILDELHRLARITGCGIDHLKIEFKDDKFTNTIAYFSYTRDKPVGFCFHINKLNDTSADKIIDVCRHEFAHYVVFTRSGATPPADSHGAQWRQVCAQLGAVPSPRLQNTMTKHFA